MPEEREGEVSITYTGPEPEVFTGAALGAGLLAVLGFALGGPFGAVVGGALGGGFGASLGAAAAKQRKERERRRARVISR